MKKEFMKNLTKEQHKVMVGKGTEIPFTGKLLYNREEGNYTCAACENLLFKSKHKFDSGTGWPSFYDLAKKKNVKLEKDFSLVLPRIEVKCVKCGAHLGNVFEDGPKPTGKRYCINSCALHFKSKKI